MVDIGVHWCGLLLTLAMASVACSGSGGQGEENSQMPDNVRRGSGQWSDCLEELTALEFDEPTTHGFTAEDVKADLEGQLTGTLVWGEETGSVTCAERPTEVTIEVTVVGSEAYQVVSRADYHGDSLPPLCPGVRLELDISLQMATSDGELDETWSTVATAQPKDPRDGMRFAGPPSWLPDEPCGDRITHVAIDVDPDALNGSYDPRTVYPDPDSLLADFDSIDTTLNFLFCDAIAVGEAQLAAEKPEGGGATTGVGGYAFRWRAAADGDPTEISLINPVGVICEAPP